ncbi:hypothetical protein ACO2J1_04670 [Leptospira interrogans]|uniref:Uncharacterized protein n=2 Tax=Leptospira interrogans TaxID=173 RepID=A0AAV9FR31_LEPIR|nr:MULTISPECIES: hypothetical protein [Leptospira]ASV05800.1 hypothetical protein B2G47_06880 [Leptospira interrogans serovar Canicola]ASV08428.1 hypothetical protein B2G50_03805 [Leptospira interrogans serovar Canicola]KAK2619061.1 hypothetical protein CFV95_008645 [Leptospira interrogans]KGE27449.1 hypothetical protein IQ65_06650 [Leptospira interrogans serovar Lai]KYZ62406.1 hypothetical protein AWU66_11215 [Leptospira interrogans serovar Pomona]
MYYDSILNLGELLWPKLRPRIGNLLELLQYKLTGKIVHKTVLLSLFQQERLETAKNRGFQHG